VVATFDSSEMTDKQRKRDPLKSRKRKLLKSREREFLKSRERDFLKSENKLKMKWEGMIRKYSSVVECDVIDLVTLQVVEDNGHLSNIASMQFGADLECGKSILPTTTLPNTAVSWSACEDEPDFKARDKRLAERKLKRLEDSKRNKLTTPDNSSPGTSFNEIRDEYLTTPKFFTPESVINQSFTVNIIRKV